METVQLQRAHQVERADQRRDHQGQRVVADIAGADPAHDGQAHEEDGVMEKSVHGSLLSLMGLAIAKGF
ncbi:hypothetical protein D3C72_2178500 [compost metagenome]